MNAKIRKIIAVWMVLLSVGGLGLATPVIKDFSSTGGHTQNKTNAKDTMYLVRPGDKITFAVKSAAEKYEWQVNKKIDAEATGNSFVWTAPKQKGIWEIHVEAVGDEGEAHHEWVVSTLPKAEAPVFFDSFTDKKHFGELKTKLFKRNQTDPWGRTLPEWTWRTPYTVPDCKKGFMEGPPTNIYTKSKTAYGTWKFRYRYPPKMRLSFNFFYIMDRAPKGKPFADGRNYINYQYGKMWDSHHHCAINFFSTEYDGCTIFEDGQWHDVTIVRTPDGWLRTYRDGIFEMHACDLRGKKSRQMWIYISAPRKNIAHNVHLDGFEVYENRFLFPDKDIAYCDYASNMKLSKSSIDGRYYYRPVKKKGIVLNGRRITLVDIAGSIDKKYFKKTGKNEYTCYTNLVLDDGAELTIKNETLKFHCRAPGQWEFCQNFGSTLRVENSTITTADDNYFVWNNCSPTTHFAHKLLFANPKDKYKYGGGESISYANTHDQSGYMSFTANNSTINNTTHIYFDSPYALNITNTKFTNMRATDIGTYEDRGGKIGRYRRYLKGKKSFWVCVDDLCVHDFTLRNLEFTSKEPLDLTFGMNSLRDRLNVYDIDVGKGSIVLKDVPLPNWGQSHTWKPYKKRLFEISYIDGKLGLVNCRFADLKIVTDRANAFALPKYYLDVKVVDAKGNPVSGAKVTVKNEVNPEYAPENMEVTRPYCTGELKNYYHHYRFLAGQKIESTTTGINGRTPLPKDAKGTVILTDFVQDKSAKKEFAYAITVEKDGKKKVITGVNPGQDWYRPDANKPTYTITAVLDGKTITEAELKR